MTIEEVRAEKKKLQSEIFKMVEDFENRTKAHILKMEFLTVASVSSDGLEQKCGLEITAYNEPI
jgi:hypothetical protein